MIQNTARQCINLYIVRWNKSVSSPWETIIFRCQNSETGTDPKHRKYHADESQSSPPTHTGRWSSTFITANVFINFTSINAHNVVTYTHFRTSITARGKWGVRHANWPACPASSRRPWSHTVHRGCWNISHQGTQITRDSLPYILSKSNVSQLSKSKKDKRTRRPTRQII